ncbi:macro domain-containing protein [Actinoplanes sp. NPDC020271]|uniref:macro domain-containing protein n=1 Tax=Actinoplanes sp. NPDC020271 TaxID=3363896 RepID=UPI0037B5A6E1
MLPAKDAERFRSASGPLPFLAVLGPAEFVVEDTRRRLPPKSLAVLLRLAVQPDEFVTVAELYRDVWGGDRRTIGRVERTQVQKAVNTIRRAAPVPGGTVVETYQHGHTSSYRLRLDADHVDFRCYRRLVEQARRVDAATAVRLLRDASSLWRGDPMPEVADLPFAAPVIRGLRDLRAAADRDLVQAYADAGRSADALDLADRLSAGAPDDPELTRLITSLRARHRSARRDPLRRVFDGPHPFVVSVVEGDIFAMTDAHLVIGFTDTFDTDTRADLVINSRSLQAEATRRLFGDRRQKLDQHLRTALRNVTPLARETRAGKRHGKLIRYPVGTVAVLRAAGRQMYAVAYSRLGNDLVARSSEHDLTVSLDRLWDALYLHGQLQPVAVPLIGAGLSRIDSATPDDLVALLVGSFVARNRAGRFSTELRIVLRPGDLARLDLQSLAEFLGKQ